MIEQRFQGGVLLQADATSRETMEHVRGIFGTEPVPIVIADPPYGEITTEDWDAAEVHTGIKAGTKEAEDAFVNWMLDWTRLWSELLSDGGAMYVYGGVGRKGFRPFFQYMSRVERETALTIASPITWKKKRGYGLPYAYLFAREEIAYMIKGDPKKPRCFHIPLTDKVRGYSGYSKRYPAKSNMLRRTNVWEEDGLPNQVGLADGDDTFAEEYRMSDVWDETELLRGKRHECEKPKRVNEIPIETHTEPGEGVIDLFSGSGSCSEAARRLGRAWVAVERDTNECAKIAANMLD